MTATTTTTTAAKRDEPCFLPLRLAARPCGTDPLFYFIATTIATNLEQPGRVLLRINPPSRESTGRIYTFKGHLKTLPLIAPGAFLHVPRFTGPQSTGKKTSMLDTVNYQGAQRLARAEYSEPQVDTDARKDKTRQYLLKQE